MKSWAIYPKFDFIVRVIDDQQLVYHTGSGGTHWLGTEASFFFGLLWNCKTPMTTELLITQAQQSGFNRLAASSLEEILNNLCALHLVKIS